MISLLVYLLAVLLFVLVFVATRLAGSFATVMTTTRTAMQVLQDADQDDDAKERAARQAGVTLLSQGLLISFKGALAVLAAGIPFWAADALGLESWQVTTAFALRWDVLLLTLLAGTLIWVLRRPRASRAS